MTTNTIRLSLSALVLVVGVLFCVAVFGGALGSRLFPAPLPLRSDTSGTIVPVSQQVTISPNKLSADMAAEYGKSLFLIAHEDTKGITPFGIGIALTNDGVIMSVQSTLQENVVGIGEDGAIFPLTAIGDDELSGISFFKATGRIVTPLNLSQNSPRVGSSFLALARHPSTFQTSAHAGVFTSTLVPSNLTAPGIQHIAQLESTSVLPIGTALLDENGALAGAVLDTDAKTGMYISDIRSALERLSSNRLTLNPFESLGFTVSWKAQLGANRTMRIQPTVNSVAVQSPADIAGLQVGDILTAISGNTVSWDTNIASALTAKPLSITIMRKDEQRTLSLQQ